MFAPRTRSVMFTGVRIEGYRGLRLAQLEDFSSLNVFVGPNGSGKSALLECIFMAATESPASLSEVLRLHSETGESRWLFYGGQSELSKISVELVLPQSENNDGQVRFQCEPGLGQDELLITTGSPRGTASEHYSLAQLTKLARASLTHARARFVEATHPRVPLPQLYTESVRAGLRNSVFDLVKTLIPGAQGLEILTSGDGMPELNVVFGNRAAPVSTLGDGLHSLIQQSLELASEPGGTILLEEPEALKHPAAIAKIASAILAARQRGTQIFLTTHSLELIDCLVNLCDKSQLSEIAIYRLLLNDGSLVSSRLSGWDAKELRDSIEEDLR